MTLYVKYDKKPPHLPVAVVDTEVNMFDLSDMRKCCECENAKPKESFHDENGNIHQLWFCGKHKQFITELTFVQSTCKGKDYKKGEKLWKGR